MNLTSNMNYKILTLKDAEEWKRHITLLPENQQDIYYTPEYYSLYENYGNGKALCFVFEKDGDIALYPFLRNSINELGYVLDDDYFDIQGAYGYNGVISSSYSNSFIKEFYNTFHSFCKDNMVIAEFVRFHPLLKNYKFSSENYKMIFDRKTVFIDTSKSEDEIFSKFQTTTRKQIRRCINRYKIKVLKKEKDLTCLDDFLQIYWETMERVKSIKYLYFNKEYFQNLILRSNAVQYIAIYENKPIASITALFGREYMYGHLGGALTEYLNVSAYSLLYWEMIKTAKQRGLKFLNVGGGSTTSPNDKLLEFKKNFSSHLADFYIGKKIHNEKIYERVVSQWREKFPNSYQVHKNKVLGYREISEDGQ